MRVAIYARYASDLQHERSIDDQLRVCRDRAIREGWTVHDCYTDYAISGADMRRNGLQNLLRDARAGRFNVVLSEALDRLSRDQADIATIFKRMEFDGIEIVTLSEGHVGVAEVGFRGTMNQLYSIETANKVRRGQQGRIIDGKTAGGIPYGYDLVRQLDARGELIRGERKINEAQARIALRIFEEYASGQSVRSITKRLNQEGVPGPGGTIWRPNTISGDPRKRSGILNNEVYIGRLLWNRRSYSKDPETGKRRYRVNPEIEWIRGEAPSLQVVKQPLWNKVRERQRRSACPKAAASLEIIQDIFRGRPRSLLTGLVKCGSCGGSFAIRQGSRFGCATHEHLGTCPNHLRIGRFDLEGQVL